MLQLLVWLIALFVASIMATLLGVQLLLRRNSRRIVLLAACLLAMAYCLLAADNLHAVVRFNADRGVILLIQAGIISLAALAVALQFGALPWLLRTRTASGARTGLLGLFVCQVVIAGWVGLRFQQIVREAEQVPLLGSVGMEPIVGEGLLTDKGRILPVYRSITDPDLSGYDESLESSFFNRRVTRSGKDDRANCHGWVFTGGQYLLTGDCVAMILADNDYQKVTEPAIGDVIVYRDAFDRILHTGLVRLKFEDGQVLIESKWGIDERYLHLPEDQIYSQQFSYYRRKKSHERADVASSHLVQAVKLLPSNEIVAQRPEEALVAQPQSLESFYENWPGSRRLPGQDYPMGAE